MVGRNVSEAEDLTHDVFLAVHKARHRIDPTLSFKAWIKRTAINHTLNKQKRVTLWSKKVSEVFWHWYAPTTPTEPTPEDGLGDMDKAMQSLSAEDRLILTLKEVEDYSYKELAELLDSKVNALEVRFYRAKKKLKAAYIKQKEGK